MASVSSTLRRIKDDLAAFVPKDAILDACRRCGHQWRQRKPGPVQTIHLGQVKVTRGQVKVGQVKVTRTFSSGSADDGTLDERFYALQDANFNLTAIIDANGDAQERYSYTPYGVRTIHDGTFESRAASTYDWTVGHQGLAHDGESGLVYNRNRMLSPVLGRFIQRDPLKYVDGMDLYEYLRNSPCAGLDPSGLGRTMPCCNGKKYNPVTHGCCGKTIYQKMGGRCCAGGKLGYKYANWQLIGASGVSDCTNTIMGGMQVEPWVIAGVVGMFVPPVGIGAGVAGAVDYVIAFDWCESVQCMPSIVPTATKPSRPKGPRGRG